MFISKVELGKEWSGEDPRGLATLFLKDLDGYRAPPLVSPEKYHLKL